MEIHPSWIVSVCGGPMSDLWHHSTSQLYYGFLRCVGYTLHVVQPIALGIPLYHTQGTTPIHQDCVLTVHACIQREESIAIRDVTWLDIVFCVYWDTTPFPDV